jgi:Spy/CpxP family protein refolding chaperone
MKKTLLSTMAALLLLASAPLVAQGPPPPGGPGGPGGRGGPGGPGGQGGPGAPKEAVVTFLKLTEAQAAAADTLATALKGTLDALDVEIKANREAVDTALAAAQPDAAAVGALVIAGRALEANVKVAHDDFDTKFTALLTDEQKSRLAIFKEVLEALRPPAGGPQGGPPSGSGMPGPRS